MIQGPPGPAFYPRYGSPSEYHKGVEMYMTLMTRLQQWVRMKSCETHLVLLPPAFNFLATQCLCSYDPATCPSSLVFVCLYVTVGHISNAVRDW